jgi:hypothetical protein
MITPSKIHDSRSKDQDSDALRAPNHDGNVKPDASPAVGAQQFVSRTSQPDAKFYCSASALFRLLRYIPMRSSAMPLTIPGGIDG